MLCISRNWSEADSGELPELLPSEAKRYASLPFHLLQITAECHRSEKEKGKIRKPNVILSDKCIKLRRRRRNSPAFGASPPPALLRSRRCYAVAAAPSPALLRRRPCSFVGAAPLPDALARCSSAGADPPAGTASHRPRRFLAVGAALTPALLLPGRCSTACIFVS
jgi:hypothetical protein